MAALHGELGDAHLFRDFEEILLAPGEGTPRHFDGLTDRVVSLAKRLAPVETGELRESIHAGKSGKEWSVTAEADYALYVEQGHRVVGRDGQQEGYVPPQPFLRPAMDEVARNG